MKNVITYLIIISISFMCFFNATPTHTKKVSYQINEQKKEFSIEAKDEFFSYLKNVYQKHIEIGQALLLLEKNFSVDKPKEQEKAENLLSTKWQETINYCFNLKFKNREAKQLSIKFIKEFSKTLAFKNMNLKAYGITIDDVYEYYLKPFTKNFLKRPDVSSFEKINKNSNTERDKIKTTRENTNLLDLTNYISLHDLLAKQLQNTIIKYIKDKVDSLSKSHDQLDQKLSQTLNDFSNYLVININKQDNFLLNSYYSLNDITSLITETSEEELYQIFFEDDEKAKKLCLNFFDVLLKTTKPKQIN